MFYIKSTPTENGNYGNPSSRGELLLPDDLLTPYLDSMGFVTITDDGETVLTVKRNEEAYNAYIESLPEPTPPEPTQLDRIEAQTMFTALMTDTLLEEV